MLVLSRKLNEAVRIDEEIEVKVLSIHGNRVKLGLRCPKDVAIQRKELVAAPCGTDHYTGRGLHRAEDRQPCQR